MKIHFLGSLTGPWSSGWQRMETLRELGHDVVSLCQSAFLRRAAPPRWKCLVGFEEFDAATVSAFNRAWLESVRAARPDVAWLEWPKLLEAATLERARACLPGTQFVSFFDDNPFGHRTEEAWQWSRFLKAVPQYDLHWVKRASDIVNLKGLGAREARLFMHGCYDTLFHPAATGTRTTLPVTFVGTALDHRVPFMRRLLLQERLPVHIYGNRWNRSWAYFVRRRQFHPPVLGAEYVGVLQNSVISLAFISSSNRDEYSMRTFEIPACAGFMLAERTPTHCELFEEGKEAEFFESVDECADKIRFYLSNESVRRRIAQAGYERCTRDDYSLRRRMRDAVGLLDKRNASRAKGHAALRSPEGQGAHSL